MIILLTITITGMMESRIRMMTRVIVAMCTRIMVSGMTLNVMEFIKDMFVRKKEVGKLYLFLRHTI